MAILAVLPTDTGVARELAQLIIVEDLRPAAGLCREFFSEKGREIRAEYSVFFQKMSDVLAEWHSRHQLAK